MDEREFSRLVEKYQRGLLKGEEKELMDAWFDAIAKEESPAWTENDKLNLKNKILSKILEKETLPVGAQKSLSFGEGFRPASRSFSAGWVRPLLKIAATILLISLIGYGAFLYYKNPSPEKQPLSGIRTGNEPRKIMLSDGSLIWLKENSTLSWTKEFSNTNRLLSLDGEALFEITKDPNNPFRIMSGELTTTVLGTSFNIKTTLEQVEVFVLTGKVSVTTEADPEGIILLPNEKVVYHNAHKELSKVEVPSEEKLAVIQGTQFSMEFKDTSIGEIAKRIEGKFNVRVTLADQKISNCIITADFTDQPLNKTLDMISQALGLQYEIKGNTITITGPGCD